MDTVKHNAIVIGQNIKRIRSQKGITQKELAAAIGKKPQQISQYEKGKRCPKFDKILDMSVALGVDFSELLLGVDDYRIAGDLLSHDDVKSLWVVDNFDSICERIFQDLTTEDIEELEKYADFLRSRHKA